MDEIIGRISEVYSLLEDQESKDVYMARLNWSVTGDYRFLSDITEKYRPELGGGTFESFENIVEKVGKSPIIFYGAGGDAYYYRAFWKSFNKGQIIGFCDSNPEKQKNGFCGENVLSIEKACEHKDAFFLIMSSSHSYFMKHELLKQGISSEKIIEHIVRPLNVSRDMYFEPSIINLDEEIFVDGGSYDLSKPLDLYELCNVKKVYAFEPDKENYESCKRIIAEKKLNNVTLYPYGLWSKNDTLRFNSTGDSAALISENGTATIEVRALDDIIDAEEIISFIKMDIEGAEMEALKGASNIIRKNKPKLAICIYHKLDDMIEIPCYIKELVPEYKFYLRAYSNKDIEMVLYAVL